jgi:transcriptional regulator with XRE-family HTH domain
MCAKMICAQERGRLVAARLARGWSQWEVADKIGTTNMNISRWERGLTRPGPYFRRKLCALFGVEDEHALDLADEVRESRTAASGKVYDPAMPLPLALPLVGRERDLARVNERLCSGSGQYVALAGLPGVGKTALATIIVHDPMVRTQFHDGVLWAGLGPHSDVQEVLSRWGALLGIPAQMAACSNQLEARETLRMAIGAQALLIVLDDVWRIEDAAALRVGGANSACLVTTRLPGLAAHLDVEGGIILRELDEEKSLALLRERAPLALSHNPQRVAALVRAVGGLPLALVVAGTMLRQAGASGQIRRLDAALERLLEGEERLHASLPQSIAERHPSLSAGTALSLETVIGASAQMLPRSALTVLRRLSAFPPKPATFSEQDALARTQGTPEDFDVLCDLGLLEICGQGRYTLHPTVADYARYC